MWHACAQSQLLCSCFFHTRGRHRLTTAQPAGLEKPFPRGTDHALYEEGATL